MFPPLHCDPLPKISDRPFDEGQFGENAVERLPAETTGGVDPSCVRV